MLNNLPERSIVVLQQEMTAGRLTAQGLVQAYLERIAALDRAGPRLRSVIEVNPEALAIARALDMERAVEGARGPLHGIPILLKDNIDTADPMQTTAGSLALLGSHSAQDATVAARLRQAGAIILGKTNLSEWANFRSTRSVSGWSGRGGQTLNPYRLTHNPCGSSSGSATAVAAHLAAAALGTETDGSIVCPASACGIVGLKPTVGLTSRAGVIPISHTQDTIGPMTRSVADAAVILGTLTGIDGRDPATAVSQGQFYSDYTPFLDPNGLRGARIGVARQMFCGQVPPQNEFPTQSEATAVDALIERAIQTLSQAGAIIIDPADLPSTQAMRDDNSEYEVLLYEFKADLAAYLATRQPDHPDQPIPRTLADLIAFNQAHAEAEMPYFGQEIFELSVLKGALTEPDYLAALATSQRLARDEGLDAALNSYDLEAIIAPSRVLAWPIDFVNGDPHFPGSSGPAARAGYPLLTVPAGFVAGLPVGLTFMGRAFSEPTLIRLGYAFEQLTQARRPPQWQTL